MIFSSRHSSRKSLKKILYKLGIRSAGTLTIPEMLEDAMNDSLNAFGKPDELIIDYTMLDLLKKEFGTEE